MTDLERRLSALERTVQTFQILGENVDVQHPAFRPKPVENTSTASHEEQLVTLEKQWHGCQITGEGLQVHGNMSEGWIVSGGRADAGAGIAGASAASGAPPPPPPPIYEAVTFNEEGSPDAINVETDATGWMAV